MSVWPSTATLTAPTLLGSEGELVSISVIVEPRDLEDLLEALAVLDFPINPQIYHDAAVIYVERDGRRRTEPSTIVEFPAYAGRLPKIGDVLKACGFDGESVSVCPMLDDIHSGDRAEPAHAGANGAYRILQKRTAAMGAGSY